MIAAPVSSARVVPLSGRPGTSTSGPVAPEPVHPARTRAATGQVRPARRRKRSIRAFLGLRFVRGTARVAREDGTLGPSGPGRRRVWGSGGGAWGAEGHGAGG